MLQNNVQNCARVMKGDKPCIALMGEFSAGKTTLINFLLGEEILPTQVTATHVPPVWISQGEGDPFYIDTDNHQHPLDLTDIQSLDVARVRYIKIFSTAEILAKMDLIDTPGISDPNIPEFHKDTAIENADAMIWCTHATQAWRESERSAWMSLPEELRAGSILLATRSDKLDERSRERVRRRLVREAGDLFGHIIMFSATDALLAVQDEDLDELLESSGGRMLQSTLDGVTQALAGLPSGADTGNVTAIRPMRVQRREGAERVRPIAQEQAQDVDTSVAPLVLGTDADTYQVSDEAAETARFDTDDAPADMGSDYGYAGDDSYDETDTLADEGYAEESYEEEGVSDEEGFACEDEAESVAEYGTGYVAEAEDDVVDDDVQDVADDNERLQSVHEMLRTMQPAEDSAVLEEAFAPHSARALWQQTLANSQVETVADVLAAIEDFVEALDQHGMFAKGSD